MASILILDDDFELAKSWQDALTKAGHTAVITHTSEDAIEQIKQTTFHKAVVDLMIETGPGEETDSGIHFLRTLREIENIPLPVLIGVSGYYGSDNGEMAKNLLKVYGVQHVLMKPFDPDVLVKLI
ncbi:MAG: response regulator [Pseudomonadota bacterium]